MTKKQLIILGLIIMLFCMQTGCAKGSYIREHPFKTALGTTLIVGACAALAYSAAHSSGGSSYYIPPNSIYVRGYTRADGTYVRPHYRTYPDGFVDNNYGVPSLAQAKRFAKNPTLPTYLYDFDGDGITNQYDIDDDNDGIWDMNDKYPYNPSCY